MQGYIHRSIWKMSFTWHLQNDHIGYCKMIFILSFAKMISHQHLKRDSHIGIPKMNFTEALAKKYSHKNDFHIGIFKMIFTTAFPTKRNKE